MDERDHKAMNEELNQPSCLGGVMCRFDFQVHFFDLWLNRFMSIGFAVLTFDNMNKDRSLFAVFYQPQDRRIWLSVCFINFRWYL